MKIFLAIYEINKNSKYLRIYNPAFEASNKQKIKIIYRNKIYNLVGGVLNLAKDMQILKIKFLVLEPYKLKLSYMFMNCTSLIKFSDISSKKMINSKNNTHIKFLYLNKNIAPANLYKNAIIQLYKESNIDIKELHYMFYGCGSVREISGINNWNTSNVKSLSSLFKCCFSLTSLADISNWKTDKVTTFYSLFFGNSSLISLPDISKWNTNNVTNFNFMFYKCISLISLPDLSKWNTSNAIYMGYIFYQCSSLISLPDISRWDTRKVTHMNYIFCECTQLKSLPDISNWKTNFVVDMSYMFKGCTSLLKIPNISKWDTSNAINMSYMFFECISLKELPDITYWNIKNVKEMYFMFNKCSSLNSKYNKFNWKKEAIRVLKLYYKIEKNNKKLKVLNKDFVFSNKNKCMIIYQNKLYPLMTDLKINERDNNSLEIKLILFKHIPYLTDKLFECESLLNIIEIPKFKINNSKYKIHLESPFYTFSNIIYKIEQGCDKIRLFGKNFVNCNNKKCLHKN